MKRLEFLLIVVTGLTSWPALAQPEDAKLRCIQEHIDGQRLRNAGRMIEAREPLSRCSEDRCPSVVREECRGLLGTLDAATPSILVEIRDAAGTNQEGGRLWLDERQVENWAIGQQIPLDPGVHRLVAEGGWGRVELPVSIRENEKSRKVTLVLPVSRVLPGAPGTIASSSPVPVVSSRQTSARVALAPGAAPLVIGLGAASAVAAGVFSVFAWKGRTEQRDMEEQCAPFCSSERLRSMKTSYLAADLALGVAALSGGAALWVYISKQQVVLDARGVTLRGTF